jgi:secondary thiamine-phosphate synthase enzyme
MHQFAIQTRQRTDFINLDHHIEQIIQKNSFENGVAYVYVPHTTAGITINENADPDVLSDLELILDRTVPWNAGYAHGEGNAAAHAKASMMGSSQAVPVEDGRLQFGTWQSLFFCEFDGPRHRSVVVQLLPR